MNREAQNAKFTPRPTHAVLCATFVLLLALLVLSPAAALGFAEITTPGEGAGQVNNPQGAAADYASSIFYVADQGNNRVDVFGEAGVFLKAFGWGVANASAEPQVCVAICHKGLAGAGKGQFNGPISAAVDGDPFSSSFHDVYVVDAGDNRVEKFDPEGHFLLTFGGKVNKSNNANLCVEGSGDVCGAGTAGKADGELFGASSQVGVGPGGVVYVVDTFKIGTYEFEGFVVRLQEFSVSGAFISSHVLVENPSGLVRSKGLVVGSGGELYVAREGLDAGIYRYSPSGTQIGTPIMANAFSIAGDANGDLFANTMDASYYVVSQFDTSGNIERRLGYGEITKLTGIIPFSSGSRIYTIENGQLGGLNRVLQLTVPPPGPIIFPRACEAPSATLGNTTATLEAMINPEGKATTYRFQYVDQKSFEAEGGWSSPKVESYSDEPLPAASIKQEVTEAIIEKTEARITEIEERIARNEDKAKNEEELQAQRKNLKANEEELKRDDESAPFALHKVTAIAGVDTELTPETAYRCRVVATNGAGEATGEEGPFVTKEGFEFGPAWASGVKSESANLSAEGNPLKIAATGEFEYVTDAQFQASGYAEAKIAPAVELDFGSGNSMQTRSASLGGLALATLYHYRLVVKNRFAPAGKVDSRNPQGQTFRTFGAAPQASPPDQRRYELVSPAQKDSANVAVPTVPGGLVTQELGLTQAAAGSGEAFTFTSFTSFGDAMSAPSASQYLSKRTADGWSTENISPFGFESNALRPPFRGFTPELTFAGVVVSEPPCAEGAVAGSESLCLRDNGNGALRPLTTEAPGGSFHTFEPFCTSYAGASADGSRAIFAANGAMAGAPTGKGFSLYEASASEGLRLVSILPPASPGAEELPAKPAANNAFGAEGGGCGMGQKTIANAISTDGRRIFWTYAATSPTRLLVRVDHSQTIQLDAKLTGAPGPSGGGRFLAATPDGSEVFFTDSNQLVAGAQPHDLYRYDLDSNQLEDLTVTGSEAAGVVGLLGISEDGSYAYFAAAGAITTGEKNERGEQAQPGGFNLYRWHQGEGMRFIATLASGVDENDWSASSSTHTARVSPDGLHLAFLSSATEALSGYDNTTFGGPQGPHCELKAENELAGSARCEEAYLYDAESGDLSCASCNPSGARPLGPTVLPAWSNPFEGPRYLSSDGSRLFFETFDSLTPLDENGKRDVYEAERPGTGTCTAQSSTFSQSSGFCIYLLSSGVNEDESYLLDASSDGRDIFFSTRQSLVGQDTNEDYDVYDARIDGGFASQNEPIAPEVCKGLEACRSALSEPPAQLSPGSAVLVGPGNLAIAPEQARPEQRGAKTPAKCKKGFVRRNGKCVKTRRSKRKGKRHKTKSGNGKKANSHGRKASR